jgi:hypothetical protein
MATKKYLDYEGLQRVVENIDRKYAPIAALLFKGSVEDVTHLPAVSGQKAGWMYNVQLGGETTVDFVEGAGHLVSDGENVAAVEILTGIYTAVPTVTVNDDPKAHGWYEVDGTPSAVTPSGDENPSEELWYEKNGNIYVITSDTTVEGSKTYYEVVFNISQDRIADVAKGYYTADTVMKWDLLGGVFDLEDRYLEFGAEFPLVVREGRTFLYMGNDTKVYTLVATPEGRPSENGYFEGVFDEVDDPTLIINPKQEDLYEELATAKYVEVTPVANPKEEGLYEEDSLAPGTYVPTEDETIEAGKTYYEKVSAYVLSSDVEYDDSKTYYEGVFTASEDSTVDADKFYYTEADQYKKAVIYKYSEAEEDWVAQSSSGSGDMVPITNSEIDDLFI